jgi:predicted DNA-binding transcriptional regulator AlpA
MNEQLTLLTERLAKIEKLLIQLINQRKDAIEGNYEDKPLSLRQAAKFLHLSASRVYSLIYQKKLKPIQTVKNGKIRFLKDELTKYMQGTNK